MKEILLNENWRFREQGFEHEEQVSLPHGVNLEPLDVYMNKQGIFEYTRDFSVPEIYPAQRVFLEFDGVMTNCQVFLNGQLIRTHFGGYLPFITDMTPFLLPGENHLKVVVDNRDDPQTPPGKPTPDLDFLYYGGIYRSARLVIRPSLYLTHPLEEKVNRGGVQTDVDFQADGSALLHIRESVKNAGNQEEKGEVTFTLLDENQEIACEKVSFSLKPQEDKEVDACLSIPRPHRWQVEDPHLYTLKTALSPKEERMTTLGLRSVRVDETGFYLNDQKVMLFGLNRGQQFPYLGAAASENAHRREARLLKESGINCLRLAHYPHSPAFIDECDKLGLLLLDPVPGWQFRGDKVWEKRLQENVVELVRRDRNHPSVVVFEVTPNETGWPTEEGDQFLHGLHELVKKENPKFLTGGDTVGRYNALTAGFDVPFYGEDALSQKDPAHHDPRLTLKREYGDWGYGGNNSTSRCGRGDGERAMQVQTWNFQFAHNDNLRKGKIVGDLIWEGIDHNRGYFPPAPISKSGVYDIFRLPKLSYQFVRSQKKAEKQEDYVLFLQALTWENKKKLVFYANCEKIELYGDGKLLQTALPDQGEDVPFDIAKEEQINDNYWMTEEDHLVTSEKTSLEAVHTQRHFFDGGNCRHMTCPPFTLKNLDLTGCEALTVWGYAKGEKVIEKCFTRQGKPVSLRISPADWQLPLCANDNDFLFVSVSALDEKGNVVTGFEESVTLKVENGSCIGHNTIKSEIGTASFMVKAKKGAEKLILTACAQELTGREEYICQKE